MAHHTESAGFPAINLAPGMIIRLEARSPTTDAAIAGVSADRWSIYGVDESEPPPVPDEPVTWLEVPSSG